MSGSCPFGFSLGIHLLIGFFFHKEVRRSGSFRMTTSPVITKCSILSISISTSVPIFVAFRPSCIFGEHRSFYLFTCPLRKLLTLVFLDAEKIISKFSQMLLRHTPFLSWSGYCIEQLIQSDIPDVLSDVVIDNFCSETCIFCQLVNLTLRHAQITWIGAGGLWVLPSYSMFYSFSHSHN